MLCCTQHISFQSTYFVCRANSQAASDIYQVDLKQIEMYAMNAWKRKNPLYFIGAPPHSAAGAAAMPPPSNLPSYQEQKPTTGWNDPPVLSGPPRKKPEPSAPAPNPITQPIYNPAAYQQETPAPGGPTAYMPGNVFTPSQCNQQTQQQQYLVR